MAEANYVDMNPAEIAGGYSPLTRVLVTGQNVD